jgi:hypothetical protein
MKKLFLLLVLMTTLMTVQAQHKEGDITIQPRIGITFSTISGNDFLSYDAKMKTNLTYGFEGEYFITDELSIAGGLLFTNQGYKFDYYEIDNPNLESYNEIKRTANLNNYYAAVPITLNYYLVEGLAVKAGVQPAFRVKTKMKGDGINMDLDDALDFLFPNQEVTLNKFDLSIPVGFSYEYNRVTFDARYNFGLIKIFKDIDANSRNKVISLTLGYKL